MDAYPPDEAADSAGRRYHWGKIRNDARFQHRFDTSRTAIDLKVRVRGCGAVCTALLSGIVHCVRVARAARAAAAAASSRKRGASKTAVATVWFQTLSVRVDAALLQDKWRNMMQKEHPEMFPAKARAGGGGGGGGGGGSSSAGEGRKRSGPVPKGTLLEQPAKDFITLHLCDPNGDEVRVRAAA
jgi:hypothetical protein